MNAGEVYLAHFPFGGSVGMKLRPVLLLTGPVGPVPEVLVACISSVVPSALLPTDLVVDPSRPEFTSTKLEVRSVLRLHKLATIHERSMMRYLGKLDGGPMADVGARLRMLLNL